MKEWRHVAYVIPNTDVTGEMDFLTLAPDYVVHAQRMWLGAVLHEIERHQAKSVAMFTPYTGDANTFVKGTMEKFGVNVCFISGMGLVSDIDIAARKPDEILAYVADRKDQIPPGSRPVLLLLHQRPVGGDP